MIRFDFEELEDFKLLYFKILLFIVKYFNI